MLVYVFCNVIIIFTLLVVNYAQECKPCEKGTSTEYNRLDDLGQLIKVQKQECVKCDPLSYSASEGATSCTQCPSGKSTREYGSKSKDNCKGIGDLCQPGYFSTDGSSARCEMCPKGTWKSSQCADILTCCRCVSGTTTSSGSTSISDCGVFPTSAPSPFPLPLNCPKGKEQLLGSCQPCDFGTYGRWDEKKKIHVCTPCPDGFTTGISGALTKDDCSVKVVCSPGHYLLTSDEPGGDDTSGDAAEKKEEDAPKKNSKTIAIIAGSVIAVVMSIIIAAAVYCYINRGQSSPQIGGMADREDNRESIEFGHMDDHYRHDDHFSSSEYRSPPILSQAPPQPSFDMKSLQDDPAVAAAARRMSQRMSISATNQQTLAFPSSAVVAAATRMSISRGPVHSASAAQVPAKRRSISAPRSR